MVVRPSFQMKQNTLIGMNKDDFGLWCTKSCVAANRNKLILNESVVPELPLVRDNIDNDNLLKNKLPQDTVFINSM